MIKVLACPFGGVDLVLTLFEKLRRKFPDKYDVTYLSYTEYGRQIYARLDASHVHIPPGETARFFAADVLAEVTAFTRQVAKINLGRSLGGVLRRAANHYGTELNQLFEENQYDHVVEFNGRMNLFITVLDTLADHRGISKLVFEQGLFRPNYVTIDGRGVNRHNSIDSLEALLSSDPFPYQQTALYRDLTSLLPLPKDDIQSYKRQVPKLSLAVAYLRMKLQPRARVFLRTAEGRDLLDAVVFPRMRPAPKTCILDSILATGRFKHVILCPFQVETDTQVLIHSPIVRTMRKYVAIISDAVAAYNAGREDRACALFKVHPMHDLHIQVDHEDAFLINESTVPEILQRRCDLVITINSTAGIEAIEAGLPVITLGEAFYNMPKIISGTCREPSELLALIRRALAEPTVDRALQKRFIRALKEKYQVRLH